MANSEIITIKRRQTNKTVAKDFQALALQEVQTKIFLSFNAVKKSFKKNQNISIKWAEMFSTWYLKAFWQNHLLNIILCSLSHLQIFFKLSWNFKFKFYELQRQPLLGVLDISLKTLDELHMRRESPLLNKFVV